MKTKLHSQYRDAKKKVPKLWQLEIFGADGSRFSHSFNADCYSFDTVQICRNIAERLDPSRDWVDPETKGWIDAAPRDFVKKLTDFGAIKAEKVLTLGELWDDFLACKERAKNEGTVVNYRASARLFFRFFDRERIASSVSKKEAKDFARDLEKMRKRDGARYAPGTNRETIQRASAVFNYGIDAELLPKNPFRGVKKGLPKGKKRNKRYIFVDELLKLVDAAETLESKVFLLFVRGYGPRVPSEINSLTWDSIDFESRRVHIYGRKTDKDRYPELFDYIREPLKELKKSQGDKSPYLFPYFIRIGKDTRNKFVKNLAERAGVAPWEPVFNTLRASAATDIARHFGAEVEAKWVGHDMQVALDYYYNPHPGARTFFD